jgi:hypothetical protein
MPSLTKDSRLSEPGRARILYFLFLDEAVSEVLDEPGLDKQQRKVTEKIGVH